MPFHQDYYRVMKHNLYFHIQRLGVCLEDILRHIETTTDIQQYKQYICCYNDFEKEMKTLILLFQQEKYHPHNLLLDKTASKGSHK